MYGLAIFLKERKRIVRNYQTEKVTKRPAGIRTGDPSLTGRMLYRLSLFHSSSAPMLPTESRQAQVTFVVSKNKYKLCENKQKVASLRQSGSRAIFGGGGGGTCGVFCFLKTEEKGSSSIVWSRDQNDEKHAEHQAIVRHFEFSGRPAFIQVSVLFLRSPILAAGATGDLHAFVARLRLNNAEKIWEPENRPYTVSVQGIPLSWS